MPVYHFPGVRQAKDLAGKPVVYMKIKAAALFLLYLFLCKRYNKHKIIKGRGAMNTEKSILIRTDGNQDIAAGHLMRCLSIAQALHEKKSACLFCDS